jgi:hypothetical protein
LLKLVIVKSAKQEKDSCRSLEPPRLIRSLATLALWKSGYRREFRIGRKIRHSRRTERGETLSLSTKKLKSTTILHLQRSMRHPRR